MSTPTYDLSSLSMVEMAVFDTSTMTGTFQPLNNSTSYLVYTGNGFEQDIKILQIYNGGTNGVILSMDGVKRNAYLPPGGTLILDAQANHANNSAYGSGTLNGRKGQIIWGMGTAGVGDIFIMGWR